MNRLQKKCFITSAGFHLLLLLILFVGPAFFSGKQTQDTQVLTFFDLSKITDGPTTGTGAHSETPAPRPQEVVQPSQPPVREVILPPQPLVSKPKPTEPDMEKVVTTEKNPFAEKTTKKTIEVSKKLVSRSTVKPNTNTSREDLEAQARAEAARIAKQIKGVVGGLKSGLSRSTVVELTSGLGDGGSVNWRDAVASAYYNAWEPPDALDSSQELTTEVAITVAANGDILSARIVKGSGNSGTDDSVRRALNRVKQVAPIPNPKDKQRSIKIIFNPLLKKA